MILSRTFNAWNNEVIGSTKRNITKDEHSENVLHLETTEVVLAHCNIVTNDYQYGSRI